MIPLVAVGIGLAAGGSIVGGYLGAGASRRNAEVSQMYAHYNAANIRAAGQYNYDLTMQLAGFNLAVAGRIAGINYKSQVQLADYNADMVRMVKDYDADILMNEVSLLWQAADLDITQMRGEFERTYGNMVAGYSASGVELNATDSPALALIDAEAQHELDVAIVRHGADIQAKKLTHQAAISRWQGEVQARQMMYEGRMAGMSQYMNTMAGAMSNYASTTIGATLNKYNSDIQAAQTIAQGEISAYEYRQQANQQIVNGWMNGLSVVGGGLMGMGGAPSSPFGGQSSVGPNYMGAPGTQYQGVGLSAVNYPRMRALPPASGGFDLSRQGTTVLG